MQISTATAGSYDNPYLTSCPAGCQCASCLRKAERKEAQAANVGRKSNGEPLEDHEQRQVDKLKERDAEVRRHEQAHVAAASGLSASSPSYTFQQGPDGNKYAIGGEVNIDVSPGRSPQETIDKARRIEAAAMAPADPSPQDHAVAAQARQMAQQASVELRSQQQAQSGGGQTGSATRPGTQPQSQGDPLAQRINKDLNPAKTTGQYINTSA